jgi:transposase, IS5 family
MEKQLSFATAESGGKKKTTKREKFLAEMKVVVSWARLIALIEPHYFEGKRGRKPFGVEKMLRHYFFQNWYALGDEAMGDTIYDSHALRNFADIAAPPSTKNRSIQRDMHQTKKGNEWHFGMKAHTGTDVASGTVTALFL